MITRNIKLRTCIANFDQKIENRQNWSQHFYMENGDTLGLQTM